MDLQLDKNRVSLLLTINTLLLHKFTQTRDQTLLKRLHSNLTCIGELSEKFNNGGANLNKVIFPSILSPPNDSPELMEMYVRLQQLFPEGVQILQRKTLLLRQEQLKRQFQQGGATSSNAGTPTGQPHQLPGGMPNNAGPFNQGQPQQQQQQQQQQPQQQQQSFW